MAILEKWTIVHYYCQIVPELSIRMNFKFCRAQAVLRKKDKNRQALIDATLDCIAEIGLIRTSVSEIISRAKLSRGMIHLHFGGKDNLVAEAAKFANEHYYEVLKENVSGIKDKPSHFLEAVIKSDLSPQVLNRRDASIWHEFRGAARTDQAIALYSDTRDKRLRNILQSVILEICQHENIPNLDSATRDYTTGFIALTEGLWTDYLLHPDEFDRQSAEKVVFRFLAGIWPRHFDENGAR